MKKALRFMALPKWKRQLIYQSIFFVWLIRISLWLISYKRLDKYLSNYDSKDISIEPVDWDIINSVSSVVKQCSRYVPYASCLTQALATRTLLRIRGQQSELKIGVKKDTNNDFEAHAWIEVDGRIIIGKQPYHQKFIVLSSFSSFRL